jgi:hypothetical protein
MSPIAMRLYYDSSVMVMPYAKYGTLFKAITTLQKSSISTKHHEFICGYLGTCLFYTK